MILAFFICILSWTKKILYTNEKYYKEATVIWSTAFKNTSKIYYSKYISGPGVGISDQVAWLGWRKLGASTLRKKRSRVSIQILLLKNVKKCPVRSHFLGLSSNEDKFLVKFTINRSKFTSFHHLHLFAFAPKNFQKQNKKQTKYVLIYYYLLLQL